MKKILTIALLCCSVMMLSGCFTAALISSAVAVSKANAERNQDELYNDLSDSKKKELIKKICETYTPKNSVLVYGTWSNVVGPRTLSMIQMDKSKPAHHLEYIGSSSSAFSYKANFFFKPCIPGGRYHACYRYQYYSSKKTVTTYYGLQGTTLHDFVAPTKPGL
ncbi:MAG: hypothetical protein IKI31_04325, partial [Treponema sp.]|nr:hypothetical protein [Treponema sp.]